jgi:hypothetical protein
MMAFLVLLTGSDFRSQRLSISAFQFFPSNDIRKGFLHAAEIPDAQKEQHNHQGHGKTEPRPIDGGVPAQQRPAEAVNDTDHGVERVEGESRVAKALANDGTAEPNRGQVQAKLTLEIKLALPTRLWLAEDRELEKNIQGSMAANTMIE